MEKNSREKNKARCRRVYEGMLLTVGKNAYIKVITYIYRESLWKVETKHTGCHLGGELLSWGRGVRRTLLHLLNSTY